MKINFPLGRTLIPHRPTTLDTLISVTVRTVKTATTLVCSRCFKTFIWTILVRCHLCHSLRCTLPLQDVFLTWIPLTREVNIALTWKTIRFIAHARNCLVNQYSLLMTRNTVTHYCRLLFQNILLFGMHIFTPSSTLHMEEQLMHRLKDF